jgi:hypothetical protein
MIVKEVFKSDCSTADLFRTYSNKGMRIRQIETGIIYDEAVDISESLYTYEETDIHIETREDGTI